jgi:hypothetical protein
MKTWLAVVIVGAVALGIEGWRRLHETGQSDVNATIESNLRAFGDAVATRLGPDAVVFGWDNVGRQFDGEIDVHLAYRGGSDITGTEAQWNALEHGMLAEVDAARAQLGIRYVLIQTAQPRPRVFELCVRSAPLVASAPVPINGVPAYAYEVYAVEACRMPAPPPNR